MKFIIHDFRYMSFDRMFSQTMMTRIILFSVIFLKDLRKFITTDWQLSIMGTQFILKRWRQERLSCAAYLFCSPSFPQRPLLPHTVASLFLSLPHVTPCIFFSSAESQPSRKQARILTLPSPSPPWTSCTTTALRAPSSLDKLATMAILL